MKVYTILLAVCTLVAFIIVMTAIFWASTMLHGKSQTNSRKVLWIQIVIIVSAICSCGLFVSFFLIVLLPALYVRSKGKT